MEITNEQEANNLRRFLVSFSLRAGSSHPVDLSFSLLWGTKYLFEYLSVRTLLITFHLPSLTFPPSVRENRPNSYVSLWQKSRGL